MSDIAVIIPTFRRPDSLARALSSVLVQTDGDQLIGEIVVVDNAPEGSARLTVDRIRRADGPIIRYVHAREPGVSNARNAGLAASTAPLIAFLDDDEEAPADWLNNLHATHTGCRADVTFGPVQGRADQAAAWKRAYLDRFFSRVGPVDSGVINATYGCGNSMMTRATTLFGPAPFDLAANEVGGEDDRLFERLCGQGCRFAWAADAWVFEHAPERRQTVRYALSRALGYGQAPPQTAARAGDWLGVLRWMAIGGAQAVVYGAMALVMALVSPARALPLADRATRGLGKIYWFGKLRFYGLRALRTTAPSGRASLNAMAAKISHNWSL